MTSEIGRQTEYIIYKALRYAGNLKPINGKIHIPSSLQYKIQNGECLKKLCENYKYIHVTNPNDGSSLKNKPTTADIILYKDHTMTGGLGISVKYNNLSMKHHRPHMLHKQMKMTRHLASLFNSEYNKVSKKWYHKLRNFTTYSEMTQDIKLSFFYDINLLTVNWLNNNPRLFSNYIRFIIDDSTPIIIKVNTNKEIDVLKKKRYKIKDSKAYVNYERGIIHIIPSPSSLNTPIIQMRLHTCERYIGNSLSLKYDVKINGLFDK